jgi:hypothetical protein
MHKFFNFLAKISRWLLPTAGALALVFALTEPALAEGILKSGDMSAITGPIAMIISGIILIIVFFALIFALGLGYLMDSTYILESGMGDTLHLVWEVMRNFVNIGFILILLIIAVMVIFGGGGEKGLGMLKKVLPKFVLALVLVNFTFFAARFVLTANDVLATAIFSLPRVVSNEKIIHMPCDPGKKDPVTEKPISCFDQIETDFKKMSEGDKNGIENISVTLQKLLDEKRFFPQTVEKLALGKKNMSLVLLSSMIDLEHILYTKGVIGDGSDLTIAAIGSLVVAGAVGIIFFMLFLAFVVRMVVLWIAIAVSPLAALGIVLKEVIPGFDMGKGGFDPMKIFISHAFMPAMVAVPLSIGMVMIFANNAIGMDPSTGWLKTFSTQSGDIHAILWWIASIMLIWFGTNKMIGEASPEFAKKLTDGVHGGVNKFVSGTAGLVKYAPIVPAFKGGGKMSIADMGQVHGLAQSKLQEQTLGAKQAASTTLAGALGYAGGKGSVENLRSNIQATPSDKSPHSTARQEQILKHFETFATTEGSKNAQLGAVLAQELKTAFPNLQSSLKPDTTVGDFLKSVPKEGGYGEHRTEADHVLGIFNKQTSGGSGGKAAIEKATGIKSDVAGENVEKNKITSTDKKAAINSRPVFKEGDTYYFANDDKNVKNGATKLFTDKELTKEVGELKARIMTATDNTDMNAIGDRIAELKGRFGELAMTHLSGIKMGNKTAKNNLKTFLDKEHGLDDGEFKKIIAK